MRNIIFSIFILSLASCTSSKHVARGTSTVDSTVIQENRMLKESIEAMSHTIERLTLDSTAVIVEFDTVSVRDTFTRVVFKEGKIQTVQGPVRRIITKDVRTVNERDSLYVRNTILEDEVAKLTASKKVETKTVEKVVKRGIPWWYWLIVAIISFSIGVLVALKNADKIKAWKKRVFG